MGAAYYLPYTTATRHYTRTTDGDNKWISGTIDPTDGDNFTSLQLFAADSSAAWVVMTDISQQNRGRIYYTTDGGQTPQNNVLTYQLAESVPLAAEEYLFAAGVVRTGVDPSGQSVRGSGTVTVSGQ